MRTVTLCCVTLAAIIGSTGAQAPSSCSNTSVQSYDGTCNNLMNPLWGAVGTKYQRLTGVAKYDDGISTPFAGPNVRHISNSVFDQTANMGNRRNLNALTTFFGQFITHDQHLTDSDPTDKLTVSIPPNDPWMSVGLDVSRMHFTDGVTTPRTPVALTVSAYIDGQTVYGLNEAWANDLRTFSDGLLKEQEYEYGTFPPSDDAMPTVHMEKIHTDPVVAAGDARANENPGLFSVHILFFRNHNMWARRLKEWHPAMTDEELYQTARRINIAEMQNICVYEWLPALIGEQLPPYTGYDPSRSADPILEVTGAAFRLGHTMVNSDFTRMGSLRGGECCGGPVSTDTVFFRPEAVTGPICPSGCAPDPSKGFDAFLRGLLTAPAQEIDTFIVDDIRNFLFREDMSHDLALINIVRSRDVGLPTLNQARVALGLAPHASWADVTSNKHIQYRLQVAYEGFTVDDLELYVGGLAEDHMPNSSLGETFCKLLKEHFINTRASDRFWFENDGVLSSDLSKHQSWKKYVYKTNMKDLIRRHSNLKNMRYNSFFTHAARDVDAPVHPFGDQSTTGGRRRRL